MNAPDPDALLAADALAPARAWFASQGLVALPLPGGRLGRVRAR
jgi:hypothetical protein